jgi:hypothetical protein
MVHFRRHPESCVYSLVIVIEYPMMDSFYYLLETIMKIQVSGLKLEFSVI